MSTSVSENSIHYGQTLRNKKYFVTGGSRGIGAAIVKCLAEQGAQVAFSYSSRKEAAVALKDQLPGSGHMVVQMSLENEGSIEAAANEVLSAWGSVDGIVNNAGLTKDNLLLRMKTEDFDTVINSNLRGTYLVIKQFLKSLVKARSGSIVSITSVIGQTGNAGQANYAASKAGIEAFSRSLALEVASRNIRVNCIAPGFINTEMTGILTDDQKNQILSKVPMGRMAEANEVADAVIFLLSDNSKYITGHTLSVNGGLFMN